LVVNQLLVDILSTNKCLSAANIDDILNECFCYSEYSNFYSHDGEMTELLLVQEPVLFGISKCKSLVESPPTPLGAGIQICPYLRLNR
jgi:hypothetical protein